MWGWDSVLYTYADTHDVFRCPGDPADGPTGGLRGTFNDDWNPDDLPEDPEWDNIPASYRFNTSNNGWIPYSYKVTKLVNPTKAINLFESNPEVPIHGANTYFDGPDRNVHPLYPFNLASFRHGSDQGSGGDIRDPQFYNKRRLNYLFHDGHAEAVSWEETWKALEEPVTAMNGQPQDVTMWRQVYAENPWGEIMPNREPAGGVWDN